MRPCAASSGARARSAGRTAVTVAVRVVAAFETGALSLQNLIYYRIHYVYRRRPLLLGLFLVALFIWFAGNLGTLSKTWLYPSQIAGWSAVPVAKLGSWFLLLFISYALVAIVNGPQDIGENAASEES